MFTAIIFLIPNWYVWQVGGAIFKAIPTAEGWQLSNSSIFSMAALNASLDIFVEAGMENLCKKSRLLTGFLEMVLKDVSSNASKVTFTIITPLNVEERGCQLSILTTGDGKKLFDAIVKQGVIADWREPNVIRLAPVPLYNSFMDIYKLGQIINNLIA